MTIFSPKLVVADADAAVAWYARVLGAEPGERHADGDTVQHVSITVFGSPVSLKDADEVDVGPHSLNLEALGSAGVVLELTTNDPDAIAGAAVAAGATIVFEVAEQPYGARAGRFADPFGHHWIVTTPVR